MEYLFIAVRKSQRTSGEGSLRRNIWAWTVKARGLDEARKAFAKDIREHTYPNQVGDIQILEILAYRGGQYHLIFISPEIINEHILLRPESRFSDSHGTDILARPKSGTEGTDGASHLPEGPELYGL